MLTFFQLVWALLKELFMPSVPNRREGGEMSNADVARIVDADLYKLMIICLLAMILAIGVTGAVLQPQIAANAEELDRRQDKQDEQDQRLRSVERGINNISITQSRHGVSIKNVEKDVDQIVDTLNKMNEKLDRVNDRTYERDR